MLPNTKLSLYIRRFISCRIFCYERNLFRNDYKNPNITNKSFKISIDCTTKEAKLLNTQLADIIISLNNNGKSLLFNQKIISNFF